MQKTQIYSRFSFQIRLLTIKSIQDQTNFSSFKNELLFKQNDRVSVTEIKSTNLFHATCVFPKQFSNRCGPPITSESCTLWFILKLFQSTSGTKNIKLRMCFPGTNIFTPGNKTHITLYISTALLPKLLNYFHFD